MQLAPQPQKDFRHPVAEPAGAMQPDVATNAERDQQRLRVTLVAMMNNQPPAHSAYPAPEPVPLKDLLAQTAEPSHRMVMALIAKTAAAENLQLLRSSCWCQKRKHRNLNWHIPSPGIDLRCKASAQRLRRDQATPFPTSLKRGC
jgi:hypothetical protein